MDRSNNNPKKIIIFGATGNVGWALVQAGLIHRYQISVFVRNEAKLRDLFGGVVPAEIGLYVGDALDQDAVAGAIHGHEGLVTAVGGNNDWRIYHKTCRNIVTGAEKQLIHARRIWVLGGLPGLDVPHTRIMGTDLPGMPKLFRTHRLNYDVLKNTDLDWSFVCPGPMFSSGQPGNADELRVTIDEMPYSVAPWTRFLPRIAHPFIMFSRLNKIAISYEDLADFIMGNFTADNQYSKKRIGLARKILKKR
jgi:putative NADH-flavin reductase